MTQEIEQQNKEIITLLGKYPEGLSRGQVSENLNFSIKDKTLQRRLKALVDDGHIVRKGSKKATRYYSLHASIETDKGQLKDNSANVFSPKTQEKLKFLDIPLLFGKKCPIIVNFWIPMSLTKVSMSLKRYKKRFFKKENVSMSN